MNIRKILMLLVSVLFVALVFGMWRRFDRAWRQYDAVKSNTVFYDYQISEEGEFLPGARSGVDKSWRRSFGTDFFHNAMALEIENDRFDPLGLFNIRSLIFKSGAERGVYRIGNCPSLEHLEIDGQISDLNALLNQKRIRSFSCNVRDARGIGSFDSLEHLRLKTGELDFSEIINLNKLKSLDLDYRGSQNTSNLNFPVTLKSLRLKMSDFPYSGFFQRLPSSCVTQLFVGGSDLESVGTKFEVPSRSTGYQASMTIKDVEDTNLEKLSICHKFVEGTENLKGYRSLKDLILSCESEIPLKDILSIPKLKKATLQGIAFPWNWKSERDFDQLAVLETLYLGFNEQPPFSIGKRDSSFFNSFKPFRTTISGTRSLPKISTLKRIQIANADIDAFTFVKNFPNLEVLVFRNCDTTMAFDEDSDTVENLGSFFGGRARATPLAPLARHSKLKKLIFINTPVPNVLGIDQSKTLTHLEFHISEDEEKRKLTSKEWESICSMSNLQTLNVSGLKVPGLNSLRNHQKLRSLQIDTVDFKDLKCLEELKQLRKLRILHGYLSVDVEGTEPITLFEDYSDDRKKELMLDLTFLGSMKFLELLQVPHNKVKNIVSVFSLRNLRQVNSIKSDPRVDWKLTIQNYFSEGDSMKLENPTWNVLDDFDYFIGTPSLDSFWRKNPQFGYRLPKK